ncbi:TRAP transporter small permease [Zhengella sp. ZM62]|uniref:TRAP transporter small permease n=1 Tax=Zhengella sedimenti TaxID=3390035 RepID=UPI0039768137
MARAIEWLARMLALLGGLVLVALTIITCISIAGRALISFGLGPVPGDFELVEAGVAFAIFAFLPWCQLNRGHATVDLFTSFLSERTNRWIDLVSEIVMGVIIVILTWKLKDGMFDKMRYHETTFILQFPVWWAYAASLVAAVVACIIAVWMVYVRVNEVRTGKSDFGPGLGVHH